MILQGEFFVVWLMAAGIFMIPFIIAGCPGGGLTDDDMTEIASPTPEAPTSTTVVSPTPPDTLTPGDLDHDGYSEEEGDCDDDNPDVFPGHAEICDGLDNDCDVGLPEGGIDEDFADRDSDGLPDCRDTCPDDPANDADDDGVCGQEDLCPGHDDSVDSDADGVPDGCDLCPSGVDGDDSDSDGVPDACDVCPGADDAGSDGDGDGVPDLCDTCVGDDTVDTDKDGVPDECDRCTLGNATDSPSISILEATDSQVSGCVHGVTPTGYAVAIYAKTDIWYIQPTVTDSYTRIWTDGYWANSTHGWDLLTVYLVARSLELPATSTETEPLEVDGEKVLAKDSVSKGGQNTVSFAGYTWQVKSGQGMGPGPNDWSSETENVRVDEEGLHLALVFRDDVWTCSEVTLTESLGYGSYTFTIKGPIDVLDPQIVLGTFLYFNDDNEIDVEFSRWGDSQSVFNSQYVVQPSTKPGHLERFQMTLDETQVSTHRIEWAADGIRFESALGSDLGAVENNVASWTFDKAIDLATMSELLQFHVNLWLYQGLPPLDVDPNEVVITDFVFTEG